MLYTVIIQKEMKDFTQIKELNLFVIHVCIAIQLILHAFTVIFNGIADMSRLLQ